MRTNIHLTSYQLIAVTTGIILLGGAIFGSAPMVFADHSDDLKDKFAKLKELIKKWKENKKCPEKFKYEEMCDKKKPKVDITFPEKRDKISGDDPIMITASDDLSGIKEVLVKVDRGSYEDAVFDSDTGTWKFPIDGLDNGRHFVFAKAVDNVGNTKRDFVFFTIV